MFSLMGNCVSTIRRQRKPKTPVTLTLVGVDNAGKTTASFSFSGEPLATEAAPTIGFRSVKFTFDRYDITLFDVGGGKNIRPVWKNYFAEVYGFIFVVDSSTAERMDEAREAFRECLEHPQVSGKPVLLLANKQDKPDALDEVDICEMLNLESVVNSNKCPCRIDACSAMRGTGKKMDRSMREGLRWLLTTIEGQGEELRTRVESDMKVAGEARKAEAAARRERVRLLREERERQEEEERQRLGIEKKNSDDEDIVEGDPFKPLDVEELKKKEEALRAEKKRYKELKALKVQEQLVPQEPLFARTSSKKGKAYKEIEPNDTAADNNNGERLFSPRENGERVFSPRLLPTTLPPLEPLGTPFVEDGDVKKTRKKKKRTPRGGGEGGGSLGPPPFQRPVLPDENKRDDIEDVSLATPRSQPVLTGVVSHVDNPSTTTLSNIRVSTHDDFPSREMLAAGISRVPRPLDGGGEGGEGDADTPRKRKVKKKRLLRQLGAKHHQNGGMVGVGGDLELTPRPQSKQLTSLDGGDINANGTGSSSQRGLRKVWKNGFGPTEEESAAPSARSIPVRDFNNAAPAADKRVNKLSRHSQMHSNVSLESDHMGSKTWGLAEDLPVVADDAVAFRKQPNVVDDNDLIL